MRNMIYTLEPRRLALEVRLNSTPVHTLVNALELPYIGAPGLLLGCSGSSSQSPAAKTVDAEMTPRASAAVAQ